MRLIDADALKENMMIAFDCENATKYGNKDAEQQAHSYSTLMLYEISNIVEDCIDNAPTVSEITKEKLAIAYEQGYEDGKKNWLQEERPQDCSDCKRYDFPYFEIKIDKEQMQELVDKAKVEVLASIERPQGEWIFTNDDYGFWHCNQCKAIGSYHNNFCPNCGAEMRGDKEC